MADISAEKVKELRERTGAGFMDCKNALVEAESVPADVLEAKKAELLADESVQKKPEAIRPQIVEGQLKKWYSQVCLYDQPFRDEERTVRELITERISTIGENIRVRRFTRYALGEDA